MRKNTAISISFLLLTSLLIVLFPLIIQAEDGNPPATDEMTVYLIRDSSPVGAWRHAWVACNEKVIASLGSGNYCCFKVKTGPNFINIVQEKAPVGFYLLRYSEGETVYLVLDYLKGTLAPVAPYWGEALIKQCKSVPILENKTERNDGYEFTLINPGIFDIELMKKAEEPVEPDADHAVVTFVRPEQLIKSVPFGVWSEDEYLGTLKGFTYLQIKVTPGKHYFIAKSEKFSVIEANVEAGKRYYVRLKSGMGAFLARIQLMPVKKDTDDKTLQTWLDGSVPIVFDKENVDEDLGIIMEKSKADIREVLDKVQKGEIKLEKLSPEDAR